MVKRTKEKRQIMVYNYLLSKRDWVSIDELVGKFGKFEINGLIHAQGVLRWGNRLKVRI